jgi:hypothetical protein
MTEPHFDQCQFDGRHARPVNLASRITFSDWERMQVYQHKQSGERRLPTPIYSLNDVFLRNLLVVFMETRLRIGEPKGSFSERRERVRLAALAQRPRLNATLDDLNKRYVQAQIDHAPPERLKNLEMEIESLDTHLRTTQNGGLAVVAAICYFYHRLRWDSVGVALLLGVRPPYVRQILWKLNEVWKDRFNDDGSLKPNSAPILGRPPVIREKTPRLARAPKFKWDIAEAICWRLSGLAYQQIGAKFGVSGASIWLALKRYGITISLTSPSKPAKPGANAKEPNP